MITVVKALPEHATLLAGCLRKADLEEARLYPMSMEEGLLAGIKSPGWAHAAFEGDTILALYGVAESSYGLSPWLMASEAFTGHARAFLRLSRLTAAGLLVHGAPCVNAISKAATSNRRFVESHGFVIHSSPSGPFDLFTLP